MSRRRRLAVYRENPSAIEWVVVGLAVVGVAAIGVVAMASGGGNLVS